jgi:nucleotide-binding universal stress UspA family protein
MRYFMSMPAPVLAAVDPLTADLAPVRFGAVVAAHTGARLLVASVVASDDVVDRLTGGQFGEDLARDASAALEAAVEAARAASVTAATLSPGAASASRGLAFAAQETGAALLVAGSADGTPAGRTGVGATTARLLDGAPCAVALVSAGWDGARGWDTVGAAFVDSVEGRAATRGAHVLARGAGARMRMLAAVRPRAWMDGAADDLAADLRARAEESAAGDVADLLGTAVDVDVVLGDPADVLLAASGELDLLVCGARGYGPEHSALLGGVTRVITARAACPVIVLSRGPGVALEALAG